MKRIAYLAVAALVAMLILVPTALAQTTVNRTTIERATTPSTSVPLPESGGLAAGSVVLPAAALLLGSGVLAYAVLRRR
jgi:hypothetical protein